MTPSRLVLAVITLLYLGTGLCLSGGVREPWGAPTPHAKWLDLIQREDPRPFWVRLLLSLRYDFHNKDIRGGAEF